MAKKKTTQQSQTQGAQEENMPPPPKNLEPEYIEDPKEKLKSLKSLNAMLLKETVERRQQVDSLVETNGSLKFELARVKSEREALKAELTRLADDAVKLEIEGGLVGAFVVAQGKEERERADTISVIDGGTQRRLVEAEEVIEILKMEIDGLLREKGDIEKVRGEKEGEIADLKKRLDEIVVEIEEERGVSARVCGERDEAKAKLDAQIEEASVLAANLKEIKKAEVEKIAIAGEKEEMERRVESIQREKDEIERSLANSDRVIRRLVTEKGEIEKASSEKEAEIGDLRRRLEEIVVEIEKEKEVSSRVFRERDEIKVQLDGQIKDANGLMLKLREAEMREAESGDEVRALKLAIAEEKEDSKRRAQLILREKGEIELSLVKSNSVIDEMKKEIEEMVKEKSVQEREKSELVNTVNGLNALIAGLKEEDELMRQNVVDLQKKLAEGLEKEREMAMRINGLADEKEELERILESLIEEKSSAMEDFKVAKNMLDFQMQKLEQLSREKSEVEEAKNEAKSEIVVLKKQLTELEDTILSLEQSNSQSLESLVEEKSSLMKDLQEAKKNLEFEKQKLEQMSREKIEIVEAKKQAEYEIVELKKQLSEFKDTIMSIEQSSGVALESLVEEKKSVMKDLHDTKKNLEQICQVKIEIEEAKNQVESERDELKKQLTECKNTILTLEQSGLAQIDMIKKLESEVRNYKTAFDQTATENNEEKQKLREKHSEMEKAVEEMQKLLEESSKVKEEKNELESQSAALKKKLAEAQEDYEDMEAKAGVADARSKLVLSMIKNTAASISVPNGGERSRSLELVQQDKAAADGGEEVDELDAIKKAFDGRESKVEDMKRQLEFLQNSAAEAEAHKGRNFWTLVSSATILAAASIAYATRAH